MASTWNRVKQTIGVALPTSVAVVAMGSGAAWAQTTYRMDGSDTLTEVIELAIQGSGAPIEYHNIGSGQAEKNLANLDGKTVNQGIGPMSRNFKSGVLALSGAQFDLTPDDSNVLCLDAGVVAVGNTPGHIPNLPCHPTSGSSSCAGSCDITVNPLEIAFGGYPQSCIDSGGATYGYSKATTAECSHPQRLAAIARLAALQGVNRVEHFFRRDDKSGTQDTFRERIEFERWCNGNSPGNYGAVGSNLKNYDLDPVRRTCANPPGGKPTESPSRCTYYPLNFPPAGYTCSHGDVLAAGASVPNPAGGTFTNPYNHDIPCTQGWLVALSESDPDMNDITVSIGNRISTDLTGQTMGGAGKAITNPTNAAGISLNTVSYEDFNVRGGFYPMWRRLFLQRNKNALSGGLIDAGRNAAEMQLFNWATNRANMCPICEEAGFYPPLPGCGQSCSDPSNVTCVTAAAGADAPKPNIGAETEVCNGSNPCVADGAVCASPSNCPAIPVLASGYACNMTPKCTSNSCSASGVLSGVCQ